MTRMKKRLSIIALLSFFFLYMHADTVVLRTGARLKGTILMQNEEVLILRDTEGARFQFPRADVAEITADDAPVAAGTSQNEEEPEIRTAKKVSALLEISGGAALRPNETAGGGVGADLIIGTHHIGNRHIFIGGGLGYHGVFLGAEKYHFLPIQAALRLPLVEAKHAPVFGVALGYGVALGKSYAGGLYAGLDFGYRYRLNSKTAVAVVAFARFQQAKVEVTEVIDNMEFVNKTGRNLITPGIKLALYF